MGEQFLTTRWSVVLAAAEGSTAAGNAGLEAICATYWRPLFAFARRWGLSPEDAEDAVQGFLASLVAGDSLRRVRRESGLFRSWLMSGMKYHLLDERAKSTVLKRGGKELVCLPLDTTDADGICAQALATSDTPDKAFDRAWALTLIAQARGRLRSECMASGQGEVFEAVFPPNHETVPEDYEKLAGRLGITESGARSVVYRLRLRWRDLIRQEVAETVASREDLEAEMLCLKAVLRS